MNARLWHPDLHFLLPSDNFSRHCFLIPIPCTPRQNSRCWRRNLIKPIQDCFAEGIV